MPTSVLGKALEAEHILSTSDIDEMERKAEGAGQSLAQTLSIAGMVDQQTLVTWQSQYFGVQTLSDTALNEAIASFTTDVFSKMEVREIRCLPLGAENGVFRFACDDAHYISRARALRQRVGMPVQVYFGNTDILWGFFKTLGSHLQDAVTLQTANDQLEVVDSEFSITETTDEPVVQMASSVLLEALRKSASDIHLEPHEKSLVIRLRVDGVLNTVATIPIGMRDAVISRFKVLARLNVAERRIPQDGRMRVRNGSQLVDFRVSVMPCVLGEKIVLRVMDRSFAMNKLEDLGLRPEQERLFLAALHRPFGAILVTGPTGSGKTTTLYTALGVLNDGSRNVCSAEEPVERVLPGINQVQVNEKTGMSFAHALRAFLRQDPDVILVGEIRDPETAETAVRAALTGHLVLATLHTNDAATAIPRLSHMGVPIYQVENSLLLVVAQRLTRKLCNSCKIPVELTETELSDVGWEGKPFTGYKAVGCPRCMKGYLGRLAIYEMLEITDPVREAMSKGESAAGIVRVARQDGFTTLRENGLLRVAEGITTLEEILRVT
ncbi:type II/IV secretion system protein [Acidithiobacillus ferrivorans]|nr:type II/IV secretion system protein [Acidithiobacillus ferrivorans]